MIGPPAGVQFCLQAGAKELVSQRLSTGSDISFDLVVRLAPGKTRAPRFLGPFTHGPVEGRFLYICSGTLAGQSGSCWTRRAKIPLYAITEEQAQQLLKGSARGLEASFDGTAKDGGPACATVRLLEGGWRVMN